MFLSFLISCQTKDNQTEHSVIYIKDNPDETFAKGLSFQFIALETSDSCLISNIKHIEMEADNIYILDDVNNQIYLFKKSGKFVRTIGKRGEGPVEYMMPSCFHIDKERNELVVADPALQKLLHYDLKTFEYKSSLQTEYFEECAWLPTHHIAWGHGEGFQNSKRGRFYIKITDDKLNFKTYLCSSDFFPQQGIRIGPIFYKAEEEVFLNLPFIPSVYKLDENSSTEVYRISIENHSFASREWLKTKAGSN